MDKIGKQFVLLPDFRLSGPERMGFVEGFRVQELSPRLVRIGGLMHEYMYLVEGDDRAALIDTGGGFGSLREVVGRLTDKPVTVLLTHGHVDHAMGAGEFEEVWMNRRDIPVFRQHAERGFRIAALRAAQPRWKEWLPAMIPAVSPDSFFPLSEEKSFDLGGIHLDVWECPGHTPGCVVVLLRELRALAMGDACSNFTFLGGPESLSIQEYRASLLRMKSRLAGKFDTVLDAHGTGTLPSDIIDGVIDVCNDVLAGRTDDVPCIFAGHRGVLAKARRPHTQLRADGKSGNIFYDPYRLKKETQQQ